MRCPSCEQETMRARPTSTGVELDRCERCGSIWFDRGEVLFFARDALLRMMGAHSAPLPLLRASFAEVERQGHGAVCYLHPREIDIDQPRMPLPPQRAFKYYVGLGSVMAKLEALLQQFHFGTLRQMAERNPRDRSISLDNLLRG